jgi:hypothetical protein
MINLWGSVGGNLAGAVMLRVLLVLLSLIGIAHSEESSPRERENKAEAAQGGYNSGNAPQQITVPANTSTPTVINISSGKHAGTESECSKARNWQEWPAFAWCKIDGWLDAERTIAIFTVILAVSTIGLWAATNRLWAAGERALKTTERAFVFIDGFDFELTTRADGKRPLEFYEGEPDWHRTNPELVITRFALQPRWKNSGTTPTKNMRIQVNWCSPDRGQVPPIDYIYRDEPTPFFLAPKAIEPSDVINVPSAAAIVNWSMRPIGLCPLILVWGRAEYDDVFDGEHVVQWCYQLRLSRPITGEPMRASMIQWGDYNRADDK